MRERKESYYYCCYLPGNLVDAGAGEQEAGPGRLQEQGQEGQEHAGPAGGKCHAVDHT